MLIVHLTDRRMVLAELNLTESRVLAGDRIAAGPKLEYFIQISRELLWRVFFSKNLFYNSAYAKF